MGNNNKIVPGKLFRSAGGKILLAITSIIYGGIYVVSNEETAWWYHYKANAVGPRRFMYFGPSRPSREITPLR